MSSVERQMDIIKSRAKSFDDTLINQLMFLIHVNTKVNPILEIYSRRYIGEIYREMYSDGLSVINNQEDFVRLYLTKFPLHI